MNEGSTVAPINLTHKMAPHLGALGGPDGVLNAGGWRSRPKDSKNIKYLGSVVDGVRDMAPSLE